MRPVFDYIIRFFFMLLFVVAFEVCVSLFIYISCINLYSSSHFLNCSFQYIIMKCDFAASIKMRLQFYLILFFFFHLILSFHSFFHILNPLNFTVTTIEQTYRYEKKKCFKSECKRLRALHSLISVQNYK